MPRTKEQFEEMRSKSKGIILEVALKLFTVKGYHSTSISDIAKEAGVSAGLMYNYFSSKEELLGSIIDENLKQLSISVFEEVSKNNGIEDIRKIIDAIIAAIIKQKYSWKLIISTSFQPDISEIAKNRIEDFYLHQKGIFEKYFVLRGVPDPKESAEALGAVLHGAFLYYACSENIDELMLLRKTVIEKLLEEGTLNK